VGRHRRMAARRIRHRMEVPAVIYFAFFAAGFVFGVLALSLLIVGGNDE